MLTDDQLTDVLRNWRDWQRTPDMRLGWPSRSTPFETADGSGVNASGTWDVPQSEAYAEVDAREAKIVQAVVDDLPSAERDAVYNVVMRTRRPMPTGQALYLVYARARLLLCERLKARGIG